MFNPCENKEIILKNGTIISNLGDIGARWDLNSQFDHIKQYFKHDIAVNEGDTILDIGANVGIFSLVVYDMCHRNVKIYSFEPVYATYCELNKNFNNMHSDSLKAYPYGISNEEKEIEMTHYPNAPGLSTIYPENMDIALKQMIEHIDENIDELPDFFVNREEIKRDGKQSRFNKIRTIWGLKSLFAENKVHCRMITLSKFMEEEKISEISLLKIDTNGSEYDILQGITNKDYAKIKQIVIEIPLGKENLEKVSTLLRKNGFTNLVVEEQPPVVNKGLSYFILYAKRDNDTVKNQIRQKLHDILLSILREKGLDYKVGIEQQLDSLQIIFFVDKLEAEFSISVNDEYIYNGLLDSFESLLEYVYEKVKETNQELIM